MRIISGFLKGKSINFIKNSITRPLKDIVKENIFNILKHSKFVKTDLEKSNVLDLYSGIGSFGLECISRGAKKVTFIESDNVATTVLRNNLNQLSISKKAMVINDKIEIFLKKNDHEKYDIFFLDPPFSDKIFLKNLDLIKKNKMFNLNHIVIVHREAKMDDDFDNYINIIFSKTYGRSKIIFGTFI